jgi:pimeloyl-ACP methyl ester carboxylesterase
MSQAGAVSVAYTAHRPDRVSHLVLLGGYSAGR